MSYVQGDVNSFSNYGKICQYSPPPWLKVLKNVPLSKVQLAMAPTPIHEWKLPAIPEDVKLSIKRDDLTGSVLSGNKVRKLEFIFAHILQEGYTNVVTCGSLQSNHCRTTAIIASQLGLKSHLLFFGNEVGSSNGNLFLSQMSSATIYLVPKDAVYETDLKPRQEALAAEILRIKGEKAYALSIGGSNFYGIFGYLNAWQELIDQGVQDMFDDVVVVGGSGGTVAGLAIGNYLTGASVKIHAVTVGYDTSYLYELINNLIRSVGLDEVNSQDIVDIIDGYIGAGYASSTEDDHNLYKAIASSTGIFCDPVYVGKGVKGLISELNSNPSRFKGKRVLYIHTGGIFGLYDGRMSGMFANDKVYDWKDISTSPSTFFD